MCFSNSLLAGVCCRMYFSRLICSYEHLHNSAVEEIQRSVNEFGSIRTSKTFPSLCTVSVGKCSAHLRTIATIQAYDYNGVKERFGGDPVTAELKHVEDNTNVAVRP